MGMTWRSLDLLRENLGNVGEGVSAYIKGRQEDTRREEQAGQLKNFLASEQGQGYDPSMAQLAFSGSDYNAMNAQKALRSQRQASSPKHNLLSYKGGVVDVPEQEFGVLGKPQRLIEPEPEDAFPKETSAQFHKQAHAALQLKAKSGIPLSDIEKNMLGNYDQQQQNEIAIAGARAGATQAATQPGRTAERVATEKRGQEQAGREATVIGSGFKDVDTQIGLLEYSLGLKKLEDGSVVDADGQPADKKLYIPWLQKDARKAELASLKKQKIEMQRSLRQKQGEAAGPMSGKTKSGNDYTIEESR